MNENEIPYLRDVVRFRFLHTDHRPEKRSLKIPAHWQLADRVGTMLSRLYGSCPILLVGRGRDRSR